MAVEIIPKKSEAEFPLVNVIFYFSLILLIIVVSSWFILDYYKKKSDKELQEIEELISQEGTPEEKALEQEILSYKKKIDQIVPLISSHRKSSAFFPFLESVSHPKIFFSSLSLNVKESKATLSGSAENFPTLSQQIYILKKAEFVKNVNLSGISIGKEGRIEFNFDLSLDPRLLKY